MYSLVLLECGKLKRENNIPGKESETEVKSLLIVCGVSFFFILFAFFVHVTTQFDFDCGAIPEQRFGNSLYH